MIAGLLLVNPSVAGTRICISLLAPSRSSQSQSGCSAAKAVHGCMQRHHSTLSLQAAFECVWQVDGHTYGCRADHTSGRANGYNVKCLLSMPAPDQEYAAGCMYETYRTSHTVSSCTFCNNPPMGSLLYRGVAMNYIPYHAFACRYS